MFVFNITIIIDHQDYGLKKAWAREINPWGLRLSPQSTRSSQRRISRL